MFHPNGKNKFGYYSVGEFLTYSKLEANLLSKKNGVQVKFHFNDEVFSKYDWTKEPTESLQELYARRAKQIREQYDYIVLFYSGGADSQNVLSTFLINNLFLDEIAQMHSYEGDRSWDTYFNEEVAKVAAPWTQKILEISPHTKHRLIDQSTMINKVYGMDNNKYDFIYKQNSFFGQNGLSRAYLRDFIDDYKDIIASGKKLCFLWGKEKPMVDFVNGRYCVRFDDESDNCVGSRIQNENREWEHDEFFYWAPEGTDIVCKQAHIVSRHLKTINEKNIEYFVTSGWLSPNIIDAAPSNIIKRKNLVFRGTQYYLPNNSLHTLIYPHWDPKTFSNGKPKMGMIIHQRDVWWHKDSTQPHQTIFFNGIKKLIELLGHDGFIWDEATGIPKRTKRLMSQPYYIE